MGMFICPTCDKHMGICGEGIHVCNLNEVREYVKLLTNRAMTAEKSAGNLRDAVFMLMKEAPSLDDDTVTVSTKWLRRLWETSGCRWNNVDTAEWFISHWLAMHSILCQAFDVFRSNKHGKHESFIEKLIALRQSCDLAKKVLKYESSVLDMTPEDVVASAKE